ncbi:MAG: hypothetical protein ACRC6V_16000 [Bacteroidales bacterium]
MILLVEAPLRSAVEASLFRAALQLVEVSLFSLVEDEMLNTQQLNSSVND